MEEGKPNPPLNRGALLTSVCRALNDGGARYLVIGGYACILHGYVRTTTDLDILIERSVENARSVLNVLSEVGYGFASEWSPEEILTRPITLIGDDPAVDLFTVAWSVKYEFAINRSTTFTIDGVTIPVVGIEDLIESKRTGRVSDAEDIEALELLKRSRGG